MLDGDLLQLLIPPQVLRKSRPQRCTEPESISILFVKMRTVKRKINDETFGQKLADESVIAFEKRRHCDVSIISAEGKEIRAHQVCHRVLSFHSVTKIVSFKIRSSWQKVLHWRLP